MFLMTRIFDNKNIIFIRFLKTNFFYNGIWISCSKLRLYNDSLEITNVDIVLNHQVTTITWLLSKKASNLHLEPIICILTTWLFGTLKLYSQKLPQGIIYMRVGGSPILLIRKTYAFYCMCGSLLPKQAEDEIQMHCAHAL
jgi:hypothetical protein